MMGGEASALSEVESLVGSFATKIQRCGSLGSGMAVNLMDSILQDTISKTAAFTEGAEEFLALQVKGVAPKEALMDLAQASTAATPLLHMRASGCAPMATETF
jgi:3-hydroxyisobutyrate dehydrogenase-like beta-hydroxyacid dehydrogenase